MTNLIKVQIDKEALITILTARLDVWKDRASLTDQQYQFLCDYIKDNIYCYEDCDITPSYFIDNLVINNNIITQQEINEDPELYKNIQDDCLYHKDGLYLL